MICGIYMIKNKITKQIYIGQSRDIKARYRSHRSDLRNNKHSNEHLQNSWNKYRESNFIFRIIEKTKEECLNERERFWIKHYDSNNKELGFNKDNGGNQNKILSDETRKRISQNHANVSGENNPFFNKKHSQESIDKFRSHPNYIAQMENMRGENHMKAKLTENNVIEIKQMLKNGCRLTDIANQFDVSISAISHIKQNRNWVHISV